MGCLVALVSKGFCVDLIIATTNRGKFVEIGAALADLSVTLTFLGDLADRPPVEEDQSTFEGNALKKARVICRWSGKTTLADDILFRPGLSPAASRQNDGRVITRGKKSGKPPGDCLDETARSIRAFLKGSSPN